MDEVKMYKIYLFLDIQTKTNYFFYRLLSYSLIIYRYDDNRRLHRANLTFYFNDNLFKEGMREQDQRTWKVLCFFARL